MEELLAHRESSASLGSSDSAALFRLENRLSHRKVVTSTPKRAVAILVFGTVAFSLLIASITKPWYTLELRHGDVEGFGSNGTSVGPLQTYSYMISFHLTHIDIPCQADGFNTTTRTPLSVSVSSTFCGSQSYSFFGVEDAEDKFRVTGVLALCAAFASLVTVMSEIYLFMAKNRSRYRPLLISMILAWVSAIVSIAAVASFESFPSKLDRAETASEFPRLPYPLELFSHFTDVSFTLYYQGKKILFCSDGEILGEAHPGWILAMISIFPSVICTVITTVSFRTLSASNAELKRTSLQYV